MDAKIVALLKTAEDISKRLDNLIDAISVLTEKHKRFAINVAALDERLSFLESCQFAAIDDLQPPPAYYPNDSSETAAAAAAAADDNDDDDDNKTPPYELPESTSNI